MLTFSGLSIVAGKTGAPGGQAFHAVNPTTGKTLDPVFHEASLEEVERAVKEAGSAFEAYRSLLGAERALFLETVAAKIEGLGDELLVRCNLETGLPFARLTGERARTCGQLRLFAALLREGSWVDARIDPALPLRKPLPRPDLRRVLVPIGPVAVFGASNFPLAFSVAGGDTASAFAAGCPVIVKAHPAHPGTCELVASAIMAAIAECRLPPGIFSLLHGGTDVGLALVQQPELCAVAFTGSQKAGRALFDAGAARAKPIPVFSEMSSINPMIFLPGALQERSAVLAQGLINSFTLGVGQFCTKPGIVFMASGAAADAFLAKMVELLPTAAKGVLLNSHLDQNFETTRAEALAALKLPAVAGSAERISREVTPTFATTSGGHFLQNPLLAHEVFGPFTLVVLYESDDELAACLASLEGQLTAGIHGTPDDLRGARRWTELLGRKAGRLLVNGFPTGVEVSSAMHHGGPYPATTDVRFSSVGTSAILRFVRPVCYQDFPAELLPPALQNENPLGLIRLVDGRSSREPVATS